MRTHCERRNIVEAVKRNSSRSSPGIHFLNQPRFAADRLAKQLLLHVGRAGGPETAMKAIPSVCAHPTKTHALFLGLCPQGCPGSGKSCALFRLKKGERLLTPTPGTTGFFVESVWQAGTKLNVWEVHGEDEREKCFPTSRALCFVVDCTENLAGIERGQLQYYANVVSTYQICGLSPIGLLLG